MNEKEVIKTHITTLQALMIAFLSAIFGVFGYFIAHIDEGFSRLRLALGGGATLVLIVGFVGIVFAYLKLTNFKKDIE